MFEPEAATNGTMAMALVGLIGTLIGILGFVLKNDLARLRDAQHKLTNKIHQTLLILEIVDERWKKRLADEDKDR
jgi:hypothetical protein